MKSTWLLEHHCRVRPESTALIDAQESYTYQQLDASSTRIAAGLLTLGLQRGDRVALLLPNTSAWVLSYFAVQKIGAIVVALNPALKLDEVGFILRDCEAGVVITTAAIAPTLFAANLPTLRHCITVDGEATGTLALDTWLTRPPADVPAVDLFPNDPCTILYTSGTTGFPKGAVLTHTNTRSNVETCTEALRLTPDDRVLLVLPLFHNFGQNAAMLPCFNAGATLVLQREFVLEEMLSAVTLHSITTFYGVPMIYRVLYEETTPHQLASLRRYISAAAPLPAEFAQQWQAKYGVVINEIYGLSETSAVCFNHIHTYQPGTVGTPLVGIAIQVVDAQEHPVPPDTPGEVLVRGPNVMAGYWNRPEETAAVLRDDWFHTGDIGVLDAAGYLRIIDRIKDMVNVAGMKVYPSEVEQVLRQHPDVVEAAVYGIADSLLGEQVSASVVLAPGATSTIAELQQFCRTHIADFKVPATIVLVAALPKSRTGKVLRRVLREQAQTAAESRGDTATPPHSARDIEHWLIELWQEVLGVEQVNIHDTFFGLGGHSLLAVQLIRRIQQATGQTLPITTLFQNPTVAVLTTILTTQDDDTVRQVQTEHGYHLTSLPRDQEHFPVSFIQKRIWNSHMMSAVTLWNMVLGYHIIGPLDIQVLNQSFQELIKRHEMLRTSFAAVDGEVIQVIAPTLTITIDLVDLQNLTESQQTQQVSEYIKAEVQERRFDLTCLPLFRVTLFRLAPETHILFICIHHILIDNISLNILFRELSTLYNAFLLDQPPLLQPLPLQYVDFAVWKQQAQTRESFQAKAAYWREWLAKDPPLLALPTDYPRPETETLRGQIVPYQFSPDVTANLKRLSREMGVTLFITVLAGLVTLLYHHTRQTDIIVGSPFNNRNHEALQHIVGHFGSFLVIRNDISGNPSFKDLLMRISDVVSTALMYQDIPFEQLAEQEALPVKQPRLFHRVVLDFLVDSMKETLTLHHTTSTLWPHNDTILRPDIFIILAEEKYSSGSFLSGEWAYKTDLFKREHIVHMVDQWQQVLESGVANPDQRVDELLSTVQKMSSL